MKSMSRKFLFGASIAIMALAGTGTTNMNIVASAEAQAPGDTQVPWFEADPFWPKPLPNNWVIGSTIGLDVDS